MASKFHDMSSEDEIDAEWTETEKNLLDFVLDKYRDGVFELFNIIATKLESHSSRKMIWWRNYKR